MAVAQRARWAKKRGTKLASPAKQASQPDPTVEKPKRIMTAAWKKALAVSAKARWARFRAAKQAAVSDLPF